MDMSDFTDQTRFVKYTHVDVMDESSKYTISISGYSGNVGNIINNISLSSICKLKKKILKIVTNKNLENM